MQTQLQFQPIEQLETDVLAIIAFDRESGERTAAAGAINQHTGGWLDEIAAAGEFSGARSETATLHRPAGLKAKRLLVAGAGKPEKFDPPALRNLIGAVVRELKNRNARRVAFVLEDKFAGPEFVTAAVEGAILGEFETDHHKTDPKKGEKGIDSFTLVVPGGNAELQTVGEGGGSHHRVPLEPQRLAAG